MEINTKTKQPKQQNRNRNKIEQNRTKHREMTGIRNRNGLK